MIQFAFILVEPEEDGNIGAAARALHTMGHSDLRFVRPKANPRSDRAYALAHGSQHLLTTAPCYNDLKAALHDIDIACGTTARHRLQKYHYISARDLPHHLQTKAASLTRVALVFGGERSGLSRQDLDCCDLISTIPQSCPHPSLNLAQAVMIYSFLLAEAQTTILTQDQRLNRDTMPPLEYASLKRSLLALITRVGLPPRVQTRVMQGIARLGYEDLYLLHNIRLNVDRTLDRLEKLRP